MLCRSVAQVARLQYGTVFTQQHDFWKASLHAVLQPSLMAGGAWFQYEDRQGDVVGSRVRHSDLRLEGNGTVMRTGLPSTVKAV